MSSISARAKCRARPKTGESREATRSPGRWKRPTPEAIEKVRDRKFNAILSSGDGGAGRKLWAYLRYFTPINYAIPISVAFVRRDGFAALPPNVQAEVMAAAAETERSQFDLVERRAAENYAHMRANGVRIAESVPGSLGAALHKGAASTIRASKTKMPAEAVAIADWASRQPSE
jgi:TRAP-type C4-dicarboxylate transport system substrate-binding protein